MVEAQPLGSLPHAQRLPKGTPGVVVKCLGFGGGAVNWALDVVSILVFLFCELPVARGLRRMGFSGFPHSYVKVYTKAL